MRGAVLKTSQIPELIDCLILVAERIDRLWDREGDDYVEQNRFLDEPDPNDPAVIRQRRIDDLVLNERLADHFTEVVDLLTQAEDIDEATDSIAALLGVEDDLAVQPRLLNFPLFGLTRGGRAGWAGKLQELRDQPKHLSWAGLPVLGSTPRVVPAVPPCCTAANSARSGT